MERCVVINLPGLAAKNLGPDTPNLQAFAERGKMATLGAVLPAVNCTMQATLLTGAYPNEHGIVGDGWYHRETCEIKFWPQSDKLVQRPQIWETARRLNPDFSCAKLFWFMNMYSTADYTVTPQPVFPADGRVVPGLYTEPDSLRRPLLDALGAFPIFNWWGPSANLRSSRWIADATMWLERRHQPTLMLTFLPHLDYSPHAAGPEGEKSAKSLREIDAVCGELIAFYEARGVRIIVLSEYGVVPVSRSVALNRLFRQRGWIAVREEMGREVLHLGKCAVYAAADLQVAHIYVNNPALLAEVKAAVEAEPGVAAVLDEEGKRANRLDHPRSGELVALAEPDAWFSYFFWLEDDRAPDYARAVDIFRKPGYDPLELFLDPQLRLALLKFGWCWLKEKLGIRTAWEFIPLDASLLRGAHGLRTAPADGPVLITSEPELLPQQTIHATKVHDLILAHLSLRQTRREQGLGG